MHANIIVNKFIYKTENLIKENFIAKEKRKKGVSLQTREV